MTLVEVMVAFLFLSLGLIPIFAVITSSINLAARIENNLIAANLAQEGPEVIRAIRDASSMRGEDFDVDLPDGDYLVAWDSLSLIPYDADMYIKYDPSTHIYSYDSTDTINTKFKRRINIQKIVSACDCEIKVISEVTWNERGVDKIVNVESHIFDWR